MSDAIKSRSSNPCLRRGPAWLVFAIALIGTFGACYPQGSLNILLPVVAKDLQIDTSLSVIVTIAYSLFSGVLTLPFGRLGDRIGYQKLFLGGQVVLIAGNVLCTLLSFNFALLVVFRCVLAVGVAMVQSVVQAMLSQAYPGMRGRMMGFYSMSVSYSGAFSPLISAALSDVFGWRGALMFGAVFNVAAMVMGILFIGKFQCTLTPSDRLGTVLLVTTLSSLMIALNARTITIPVPWMIALVIVFLFSLALFVRTENRATAPLLDFKLLKNKNFALGFVSCLLGYIVSTGTNTALPFFIQDVKLQTATVSSICTMGFTLIMGTLGPFVGGMCDKRAPYKFMVLAMSIQGVAVVGYCSLTEASPLVMVVLCVALYGLGSGFFYAPVTSMVMGSVPPSSAGVASGMMSTARNLGAGIGATIFSVIIGMVHAGTTPNEIYVNGQRSVMFVLLALNLLNLAIVIFLLLNSKRNKQATQT